MMEQESARDTPPVAIDIVICTCNRAAGLDAALVALARQTTGAGIAWRVLVVDNASIDDTAAVVEAHRARRSLPELRRVFEPVQGLTAARLRGVRETNAPWVAFVDDDNLLEPGWLAAIGRAIRAHPEAGGVGGRVVLDWEVPPPVYLREFGFCFAAQDAGEADRAVDSLTGAGMVLRRSALAECGWLDRPLLADRVGETLVSGGDVEIAQRVRAAGYALWFAADAVLRHRIPACMGRRYLFRINRALGAGAARVDVLTCPGDWGSWRGRARERRRRQVRLALQVLGRALRRGRGLTPAVAWACFALGYARGMRECDALAAAERSALLGAAAPPRAGAVRGTGLDTVRSSGGVGRGPPYTSMV